MIGIANNYNPSPKFLAAVYPETTNILPKGMALNENVFAFASYKYEAYSSSTYPGQVYYSQVYFYQKQEDGSRETIQTLGYPEY